MGSNQAGVPAPNPKAAAGRRAGVWPSKGRQEHGPCLAGLGRKLKGPTLVPRRAAMCFWCVLHRHVFLSALEEHHSRVDIQRCNLGIASVRTILTIADGFSFLHFMPAVNMSRSIGTQSTSQLTRASLGDKRQEGLPAGCKQLFWYGAASNQSSETFVLFSPLVATIGPIEQLR